MAEVTGRQLGELAKGMAKFRQQVKQPEPDSNNSFFQSGYLSLTGLERAIDAALPGTGLSYIQLVSTAENGLPGVRTVILHESGQLMTSELLVLTPAKMDPQGMGSAITYAKRYQLAAAFGINGENDDDGNAASQPYNRNQRSQYQNQGFNGGYQR